MAKVLENRLNQGTAKSAVLSARLLTNHLVDAAGEGPAATSDSELLLSSLVWDRRYAKRTPFPRLSSAGSPVAPAA